ncbi:hypothetical protein KIL84_017095 [Mauremys mutica]|uniref:Uncharacterized protein n=1 Tax=Mauremys mutica TaxID=74926 RepID=A0A9D3X4Q2_9SAUR|nr:hypothetical protein KIL84_017095 [Mauremys mutica]
MSQSLLYYLFCRTCTGDIRCKIRVVSTKAPMELPYLQDADEVQGIPRSPWNLPGLGQDPCPPFWGVVTYQRDRSCRGDTNEDVHILHFPTGFSMGCDLGLFQILKSLVIALMQCQPLKNSWEFEEA